MNLAVQTILRIRAREAVTREDYYSLADVVHGVALGTEDVEVRGWANAIAEIANDLAQGEET